MSKKDVERVLKMIERGDLDESIVDIGLAVHEREDELTRIAFGGSHASHKFSLAPDLSNDSAEECETCEECGCYRDDPEAAEECLGT